MSPKAWVTPTLEQEGEARTSRLFSVAIYHEQMAYGGREEGGWWHDVGELLDRPVRYFKTEDAAYDYARRLMRHLDRVNAKRPYRYSDVNSDGRYTAMVNDGHPLPHFPIERPHYE